MKKSKTIKFLTLLSFITLLSGYVAFKIGTFDEYLNTGSLRHSHNNGQFALLNNTQVDSPQVKPADTVRFNPTMMSTSKSGIAIDQRIKFIAKEAVKRDSIVIAPKK